LEKDRHMEQKEEEIENEWEVDEMEAMISVV
jgi:hypothetical protein